MLFMHNSITQKTWCWKLLKHILSNSFEVAYYPRGFRVFHQVRRKPWVACTWFCYQYSDLKCHLRNTFHIRKYHIIWSLRHKLLIPAPGEVNQKSQECHITFHVYELCAFFVDQAAYLLQIQRQIHDFSCFLALDLESGVVSKWQILFIALSWAHVISKSCYISSKNVAENLQISAKVRTLLVNNNC